jgi:hypothetical protein
MQNAMSETAISRPSGNALGLLARLRPQSVIYGRNLDATSLSSSGDLRREAHERDRIGASGHGEQYSARSLYDRREKLIGFTSGERRLGAVAVAHIRRRFAPPLARRGSYS